MRKAMNLVIAAALVALTASAMAAPAAAVETGRVAIIQGIPGKRVDICINDKEVRSGVKFGKVTFRKLAAGGKRIKVYRTDPRTCGGRLIAKKAFAFPEGSDLTIAVTRGPRKVVVFDNAGLGVLLSATQVLLYRSAANFDAVFKIFGEESPTPVPVIQPATDPVWRKGDQTVIGPVNFIDDYLLTVLVTEPDSPTAIAGPVAVQYDAQRRYEFYVIGTSPANAKMVVLKRLVGFPLAP